MTFYQRRRKDFETLEAIRDLEDQVELDSQREELMQNPTKRKAGIMYEEAITLWLWENRGNIPPEAKAIAARYSTS